MITKLHEAVIIFRPDLIEEERKIIVQTIIDKVNQTGKIKGEISYIGNRKLAYKVKEFYDGYYISFQFEMQTSLIKELEILIRNNQNVLKYIIMKVVGD